MKRTLMMSMLGMLLLAAPAAFSCGGPDPGTATAVTGTNADGGVIAAVRAFPALRFDNPVFLTWVPGADPLLAVVEQSGRIMVFENDDDAAAADVFLDISDRVSYGGEEGLLGLAFDPDYEQNRRFYVYYSASGPRRSVLSRFTADGSARADSDGSVTADPGSEQVLLEVEQPFANHNGGTIVFGPDGSLYLGLGDGGGGGDPLGNAQDPATLLGSILRIDVSTDTARWEAWAYGFRNPYRFSFDRTTADMWAGDVGQSDREEVDLVRQGGNYGWNLFEGNLEYENPERLPADDFEAPVVDYGRDDGLSVIGGYVYRGRDFPALDGIYFYGDYGSGNIWALVYREGELVSNEIAASVPSISSFGEDRDGEVYVVSLEGSIYRLIER